MVDVVFGVIVWCDDLWVLSFFYCMWMYIDLIDVVIYVCMVGVMEFGFV